MIFKKTVLNNALIIEPERIEDERGYFARAWCKKEFEEHGLATDLVQSNISFNKRSGTLRGMHYQAAPFEEIKLVRCTKGAIYDVIIDLNSDSSTFKQWIGVELTEDNNKMLYIPRGFAHGYQTLVNETEVYYQVSEFYSPKSERGIRWNDALFGIDWPEAHERTISDKDRNWPDFVIETEVYGTAYLQK